MILVINREKKKKRREVLKLGCVRERKTYHA
jgi:hypothetical protein